MSTQDDDLQGKALFLVWIIVGAVVAGVLGFGAYHQLHGKPAKAPAAAATAAPLIGSAQRVYFELGQDSLSPEGEALLVRLADEVRRHPQSRVRISGFHDASGDAAANAELAKRRAQRVQHALEANGVSSGQVELDKPALTTGGADPRDARRVEITITNP